MNFKEKPLLKKINQYLKRTVPFCNFGISHNQRLPVPRLLQSWYTEPPPDPSRDNDGDDEYKGKEMPSLLGKDSGVVSTLICPWFRIQICLSPNVAPMKDQKANRCAWVAEMEIIPYEC